MMVIRLLPITDYSNMANTHNDTMVVTMIMNANMTITIRKNKTNNETTNKTGANTNTHTNQLRCRRLIL